MQDVDRCMVRVEGTLVDARDVLTLRAWDIGWQNNICIIINRSLRQIDLIQVMNLSWNVPVQQHILAECADTIRLLLHDCSHLLLMLIVVEDHAEVFGGIVSYLLQ